jgi:hypothetical protein
MLKKLKVGMEKLKLDYIQISPIIYECVELF